MTHLLPSTEVEARKLCRKIFTSDNLSIQKLITHPNLRIITPAPQAARALKVPHYSLESLGQQRLIENGIRVASGLLASRWLQTAVSEIIPTSDTEGTARAITPALQAILRAGVDLEQLATVGSNRTRQLAELALAYTDLLKLQGMVDPASVLWEASRIVTKRQQLLIYGYFQPRVDQLNFLNAIADDGSVIILPCPDAPLLQENRAAITWLQQQGWQIQEWVEKCQTLGEQLTECFLQSTNPPLGVKAHIYPHMEAEVRGVLTQVKSLLYQGIPANEIVLVARDDAFYGATVLDIANEYNLPIRALYAVPLIETRLGAWIQLLLEVIQKQFPFESTAKLLSHPLCSGLSAEIWIQARQQHPFNLFAWQNLGVNLSFLDWPPQDNRANWVERLQNILNKFNVRQRTGRWAREIVAYYELQAGLVQLSKPEDEVISLKEFAEDIIGSLTILTVPAQPGRGGVELHTPLSLFGAKFQYVLVLGATEGILPTPVKDDPMLDFYERKQLRQLGFDLEDAAQAARREAISFYALLQIPTQQLTFSYPEMIGSQTSLPSPYLKRLGLKSIAPPPLPIASLAEARRIYLRRDSLLEDKVLPYAIYAWGVEKRREGTEAYDEYDGVVNISLDPHSRVFSASQLTTLGQCPFKWFADKVLRLAQLEEAEEELSPSLKGQLYHRSLELVLAKVLTAADITQTGLEQLETAFMQAEQDLQLPTIPAWESRRAEHIKVLNRTLQHPDFLPSDVQVVSLEQEFVGDWYGLKVTGRIDRIDRTPEGLVLLDYKTSSQKPAGIKDENGKAVVDIQMPLYTHIANTVLFPNETIKGADYYLLTKRKKVTNKALSEEQQQQIAAKIKTHLETGYYPVEPDIEQNACRFCAYDLVCRKGTRQSRKGSTV
jgi:CRISPR/Cas system-associated exonuclease Cas4 (RecB family)